MATQSNQHVYVTVGKQKTINTASIQTTGPSLIIVLSNDSNNDIH